VKGPRYTIERWPHGWTMSAVPGTPGIPLDALNECLGLFGKKADIDIGLTTALLRNGHPSVVFAIGTPAGLSAWRAEITASLAHLAPEARWWRGVDTGKSSAAIFAAFAENPHLSDDACRHSQGATPADAADFGRCKRLLDLFPAWRARLPELAALYPGTAWPRLVPIWPQLEAAATSAEIQTLIDSARA